MGLAPFQGHESCVEGSVTFIFSILCFGENIEVTGAAEYGSSLIASIRTSLAELLYSAQRHNKIRQELGMRSDKCSKECAAAHAALRFEAGIRFSIANRSYLKQPTCTSERR